MKNRLFLLTLATILSLCSCSKSEDNSTQEIRTRSLPRLKAEESTSSAISMIEYTLEEWGYESTEGIAHNGDNTFYGIMYTNFENSILDEEGNRFFECGFFQVVSDVEKSGTLLTYNLISNEKPIIVTDGDNNEFILTQNLPGFSSFSYVFDDWYNVCKRVGDFVLEVNTYENKAEFYDFDISCYSYDKDVWLFKADEEILAFNVEAKSLYSDYSKAYLKSITMFQELIEMQNKNSFIFTSSSYAIVSGEILSNNLFGQQKGSINGVLLSEILSMQDQLQSNEVLSITPNGVKVVADTTGLADKRVEKGIISLIANTLLIAGEVAIIVVTWGSSAPIMSVAIATSVSSIIYAASNVGEAIQDVALGSQGDINTKAVNIIKEGFVSLLGDEKAGNIAYNIWGLANTIVSSLVCPINSALVQSANLDRTTLQTVLAVARVVAVKTLEVSLVALSSSLIGMAVGSIAFELTENELISAYATDCATLVAAIAIGFGINTLDNKYNLSGISQKQYLNQLKNHLNEDIEFKSKILSARNNAGDKLKAQALEDILNGSDPRHYGLDPSDSSEKQILDFVFENQRFPSFKNGDGFECQFAHAVNVAEIEQAAYDGIITWEQALELIGNPNNGLLTSNTNHLNVYHGGSWTNSTNYVEVISNRPDVSEFVQSILQMIGAV